MQTRTLLLTALIWSLPLAGWTADRLPTTVSPVLAVAAERYWDERMSGGPGKDGIPSISPDQADEWLEPGDRVIGVYQDGEAKAYPQRIVVWHEIVNDTAGGKDLSVTYCPLTGTALGIGGWEYTATQRLANHMVAHMAHDPLHEQPADAVAGLQLTRLTTGLGTYLETTELGEIVHARWCEIDGQRGAHFVIERGSQRATAFLLPDHRLVMEHQVQVGNMHGVLIPTDRGLVAVFCLDPRTLTRLVEDMRQSARWLT